MRLLVCLTVALTACLPGEIVRVQTDSLGEGLTFIRGGGGNTVVVASGSRALVFDPKMWPWGDEVRHVLRDSGANAMYVVDSHMHFDHAGENERYPNALIFAAPSTIERLTRDSLVTELPRPDAVPSVPIRHDVTLAIGGEPIELRHTEPAHTDGDVYLWMPERRLLATGDLFNSGFYPRIDPGNGGRVLGLINALDELSRYQADIIIPGHGPAATRAELVAQRDFLRSLRDAVAESRRSGLADPQIIEKLSLPAGEQFSGALSGRRPLVEGLLRELPRG